MCVDSVVSVYRLSQMQTQTSTHPHSHTPMRAHIDTHAHIRTSHAHAHTTRSCLPVERDCCGTGSFFASVCSFADGALVLACCSDDDEVSSGVASVTTRCLCCTGLMQADVRMLACTRLHAPCVCVQRSIVDGVDM